MSTRAQIGFNESKNSGIEDWKALIYIHSDDCPASILPEILPFLQAWRRGLEDSEYLAARLLQHMTNNYDTMMADAKEYKGILGYAYRIACTEISVTSTGYFRTRLRYLKPISTTAASRISSS